MKRFVSKIPYLAIFIVGIILDYIVKHIVSLYGGDVRVDSAVGVGTTFTVRLPCR